MEDIYIKEIINNYYNPVMNLVLDLKMMSIEDQYFEKNKKITLIKAYFNYEEFEFKLIETKTYAILIEKFIDIERIFKFKNKKLDNLSNLGMFMYNKKKRKLMQYCSYKNGNLHRIDAPAVKSALIEQYWVDGQELTKKEAMHFFNVKKKIKEF